MDLKKTGRLIAKRRKEMNLTQPQLSEKLLVSPQAVSSWENGTRFPDLSSQIMIEKVMGINPVELMSGVQMYDEKLKREIAAHMSKVDEKVFTGGIMKDEDGNEFYMDMSKFMVVTNNENGELSDKWIPYLEYHNVEPHVMTEQEKELKAKEDAVPREPYNPGMVYINYGPAILIIPKEILEAIGKPKFFELCEAEDKTWIGLQFVDNGTFDIPDEVYKGSGPQGAIHGTQGMCRGLMFDTSNEFSKMLCRQMGIRRLMDTMRIEPAYSKEHNMLIIDLLEAKRVKPEIDISYFALPTMQFEMEMQELMEEEAEAEEGEE